MLALAVLFLVVPIAELAVIIAVAREVGVLETIALLILVSVVGAWLCKREGIGVARRVRQQLAAGALPQRELVDGFLVLFAGALLLTPGFLSDLLAIALLVPPSRAAVRSVILRSFRRRAGLFRVMTTGTGRQGGRARWVDVDGSPVDHRDPGRPPPGSREISP